MRSTLLKLATLAEQDSASLGSFDPKPLFAGNVYTFAPNAQRYFEECVPAESIDFEPFLILSGADIASHSSEYIPSHYTTPFGFVTIATDTFGDALALDVTDGKVYHLSHEKYDEEGIHPGWNEDETEALPVVDVSRESIIETAEGYWKSIEEFLKDHLSYSQQENQENVLSS